VAACLWVTGRYLAPICRATKAVRSRPVRRVARRGIQCPSVQILRGTAACCEGAKVLLLPHWAFPECHMRGLTPGETKVNETRRLEGTERTR
jgi:hypothetical protein